MQDLLLSDKQHKAVNLFPLSSICYLSSAGGAVFLPFLPHAFNESIKLLCLLLLITTTEKRRAKNKE